MNSYERLEILSIKSRLDRLAQCDVFPDDIRAACSQAGSLLYEFRQTVLGGHHSERNIVSILRGMLANQGEG
jgi:hypothetical protein